MIHQSTLGRRGSIGCQADQLTPAERDLTSLFRSAHGLRDRCSGERKWQNLLSLCLIAWARRHQHSIQPFKVGPDYLDPQLLTLAQGAPAAISTCRSVARHG